MDYIPWIRSKVGHDKIMLVVAGVIIFDDDGKVLLQKRSKTEEVWGFPGGMMELGESAEETAVREVYEETGLEVEVTSLLGVYTKYSDQYANGDKAQPIAIAFKGKAVGGRLKIDNEETYDLQYFHPEKAPKLFNRQHNDMLEDIRNNQTAVYR
jgi:8-oxo-dGTP pyrophosphatase MutT (NUDIX family)